MLKKDQKKIIEQLVHESMTFSRKPPEQANKTQTTARAPQNSLPAISFQDILSGINNNKREDLPTPSFTSLAAIAFETLPSK